MKSALLAVVLASAVASPALADTPAKTEQPAATRDIVETAMSDPRFSTLVEAIKAAGLVDTLKGKGPFTVFAPTNEAFAKIPKDKLDALLADKKQLTAVLTYHVAPGRLMAADVVKRKTVRTVQGKMARIVAGKDGAMIGGAKIIATDIAASNGVVHVIDTVIMP